MYGQFSDMVCGFSTYETGSGYPRLLNGGRGMASPLRATPVDRTK